MEKFLTSPAIIWIGIAAIFAVIEGFTLGLTTIWFSVGGVMACIIALMGGSILVQVIVFLAGSIIALYVTRPLAKKKLKIGHEKNIVDQIIGQVGIVTSEIMPFHVGQVILNGQPWTALCENQEMELPVGTQVSVVRIEGVKLIVMPDFGKKEQHG